MASQLSCRFTWLVLVIIFLGGVEGRGCPFGFKRHYFLRSSCYWFSRNTASFWKATTICRLFDSHLAVINSRHEAVFISSDAQAHGRGNYWIGATDLRKEGIWTWENPFKKMTYSNWCQGQPDNYKGAEHCMHLIRNNGKYCWNDNQCNANLHFICEKNI